MTALLSLLWLYILARVVMLFREIDADAREAEHE